MPKRQRVVRHKSDEVQGPGSWVDMRAVSVKEGREARKESQALFDKHGVPHDTKPEDFENYPEFAEEYTEMTQGALATIFIHWNWVDDDDEPLPQPGDPAVMDMLTMTEVAYLTGLLNKAAQA